MLENDRTNSEPSQDKNGLNRWLEQGFSSRSSISSPVEFHDLALARLESLSGLAPDFARVRSEVRKLLGLGEFEITAALGEQAAGLNEPTLVLGKRLLAAAMAAQHRWRVVELFADSDTLGSEPGLSTMTIPNPHQQLGTESAKIVAIRKFSDTPTHLVSGTELRVDLIEQLLWRLYGKSNPNVVELLEALNSGKQKSNFAAIQDGLLQKYEHEIGLAAHLSFNDLRLEKLIAQCGGLELMLGLWVEIAAKASAEQALINIPGLKVPMASEAPFFAFKESFQINGLPTRLKILIANEERTRFLATHPYRADQVIAEFGIDQILGGEIEIAFRAIPRSLLLATVFDAHITGGGARYNALVAPVFKQITGAEYYPIAHMDLAPEGGQRQAIFDYRSAATRKTSPSFTEQANAAVARGEVSLVDMFISTDRQELRVAIEENLNDPKFSTSTRIKLDGRGGNP